MHCTYLSLIIEENVYMYILRIFCGPKSLKREWCVGIIVLFLDKSLWTPFRDNLKKKSDELYLK